MRYNGQKAREGHFLNGHREGMHTYWYETGKVRGVGSFEHDSYEDTWTMYVENGTQQSIQTFHARKLVK